MFGLLVYFLLLLGLDVVVFDYFLDAARFWQGSEEPG